MIDCYNKFSEEKAIQLNSQSLAFVGDSVFSLFIRTMLLNDSNLKAEDLHLTANCYVKASGQSAMLVHINSLNTLTEIEQDVVRRAKNYKTNNIAKHASIKDYKSATGFEALLGFLYITNQVERLNEIMRLAVEGFNANSR